MGLDIPKALGSVPSCELNRYKESVSPGSVQESSKVEQP